MGWPDVAVGFQELIGQFRVVLPQRGRAVGGWNDGLSPGRRRLLGSRAGYVDCRGGGKRIVALSPILRRYSYRARRLSRSGQPAVVRGGVEPPPYPCQIGSRRRFRRHALIRRSLLSSNRSEGGIE